MSVLKSIETNVAPLAQGALRIVSGAVFLSYGLIKVAGFPAGAEPGTQPLFSLFGIGGVIEIVTGTLLIAGLFTRSAAFIASGQMAIAYWLIHAPASFYPAVNGGAAAILFSFVFLQIAATGAGAFSLDSLIARKPSRRSLAIAAPAAR